MLYMVHKLWCSLNSGWVNQSALGMFRSRFGLTSFFPPKDKKKRKLMIMIHSLNYMVSCEWSIISSTSTILYIFLIFIIDVMFLKCDLFLTYFFFCFVLGELKRDGTSFCLMKVFDYR